MSRTEALILAVGLLGFLAGYVAALWMTHRIVEDKGREHMLAVDGVEVHRASLRTFDQRMQCRKTYLAAQQVGRN